MTLKPLAIVAVILAASSAGCAQADTPDAEDSPEATSEVAQASGSTGWRWTDSNAGLFRLSDSSCHGAQFYTIPAERHIWVDGYGPCNGQCWANVYDESSGKYGTILCSHIGHW